MWLRYRRTFGTLEVHFGVDPDQGHRSHDQDSNSRERHVRRCIPTKQFRWHTGTSSCHFTTGIPEPTWQREQQENNPFHVHGNLPIRWAQRCVVAHRPHTINVREINCQYPSDVCQACKRGSLHMQGRICSTLWFIVWVFVPAFLNCHAIVWFSWGGLCVDRRTEKSVEKSVFYCSLDWWHTTESQVGQFSRCYLIKPLSDHCAIGLPSVLFIN